MTRFEYNALFLSELRAFKGEARKRILGYMRSIERAPFATGPNRVFLPPMWRPGTVEAQFDDIGIRYYLTRDDETGTSTVVFLRIIRKDDYGFDPNAM